MCDLSNRLVTNKFSMIKSLPSIFFAMSFDLDVQF